MRDDGHRSRKAPTTPSGAAVARLDRIDLLRGFSVAAVVLLHASLWLFFGGYRLGAGLPAWLRGELFREGGNGVTSFFAISGFLITYVSVRRFGSLARLQPLQFYRIRFARIFPLLALLLGVLSALHLAHVGVFRLRSGNGTLPQALWAALSFQLNWYEVGHGYLPAPWTVLWSLSVEEMFYLVFPLLCLVTLRTRWTRPLFFAVLVGLILYGPFARLPSYSSSEVWLEQSYLGNIDNIALGCLFALLTVRLEGQGKPQHTAKALAATVAGTVCTLFIVVWAWPRTLFGWHVKRALGASGLDTTVLGLGICLLMVGSVLRPRPGRWWTAPVRWLGRRSYEVYLFHEFVVIGVLSLFLRSRREPAGAWVFATLLLAAAVGALLARFISEPANRALRGAPLPTQLPDATTPKAPAPALAPR